MQTPQKGQVSSVKVTEKSSIVVFIKFIKIMLKVLNIWNMWKQCMKKDTFELNLIELVYEICWKEPCCSGSFVL